jgi:trk system potassium uptake protein
MYVIIVGCGKLGSLLANSLSLEGQDVVVLDKNSESFACLDDGFSGFAVNGDATELEVLQKTQMQKADIVAACTENDNVNMMVAQIARDIYRVPKVMARVFDPNRASIYRDLNIQTICPTQLSVAQFRDEIMRERSER